MEKDDENNDEEDNEHFSNEEYIKNVMEMGNANNIKNENNNLEESLNLKNGINQSNNEDKDNNKIINELKDEKEKEKKRIITNILYVEKNSDFEQEDSREIYKILEEKLNQKDKVIQQKMAYNKDQLILGRAQIQSKLLNNNKNFENNNNSRSYNIYEN
jgi:hypothetical protein